MHPQTERLIEVAGDGFREAARIADAHRVLATASATRHRVLVVDQDVRVRTLLLRALLDRGHAAAAADGLARLTRSPYRRFRWCVAFVDVTGRARPRTASCVSWSDPTPPWSSSRPTRRRRISPSGGRTRRSSSRSSSATGCA